MFVAFINLNEKKLWLYAIIETGLLRNDLENQFSIKGFFLNCSMFKFVHMNEWMSDKLTF